MIYPHAARRGAARASLRGSALAFSLAMIALISALGVGLVQLQAALDKRQTGASDRRSALYVAEAGISEATLAVSQGRSGNIASEAVPARLGDSVYWVEAEELSGGRIRLMSQAASGTQRFAIQAVVLPSVSPIGEYGFFGEDAVEIGWGSVLDGYDSGEGSFEAQLDRSYSFETTGEGAEVHSNGDILFAEEATVPPPGEGGGHAGGDQGQDPGASTGLDGADGQDGDDGATGLAIWDSFSESGLDPRQSYALRASGNGVHDFTGLLGTDEESLAGLLTNLLWGSAFMEQYQQVKFAAFLPGGGQRAISSQEYVYLRYLGSTGTSAEDLELVFASSPAISSMLLHGPMGEELVAKAGGLSDEVTLSAARSSRSAAGPLEPMSGDSAGSGATSAGMQGTFLFGEATPGEDSYVASAGSAYIEEAASAAKEPLVMPRVVVPDGLNAEAGVRDVGTGSTMTFGSEDRWIDGISVESGGRLEIVGPAVLAVATLDVATGGELVFDDSHGPIQLYVTDRMDLAAGSEMSSLTPHESAMGTHVFIGGRNGSVAGNRVSLMATGDFHGVFYAPEDDLLIPNTLRFYGSAAAKRLMIQDFAHASYDLAFATNGVGVPSLPKILSWQVIAIEEGEVRSLRFNPILSLAARGITPVPSATAASEQDFEVTYLDAAGAVQTYAGDSASFDWSNVGRLSSLRWMDGAGAPMRWTTPSGYDPQLLLNTHRADERMRVYGTVVVPHPAGADAEAPRKINEAGVVSMGIGAASPVKIATPTAFASAGGPLSTGVGGAASGAAAAASAGGAAAAAAGPGGAAAAAAAAGAGGAAAAAAGPGGAAAAVVSQRSAEALTTP